ncbi:hypothetical protein BH23GEM11_BH23GEM11_11110 [soil metagenome]
MTLLALAHGTGIGLALAGFPTSPALVLLLILTAPFLPWRRPEIPLLALALAGLAGLVAGSAAVERQQADCRLALTAAWSEGRTVDGVAGQPPGPWTVEGRFVSRVEAGRASPFRIEAGLPGGCRATLRVSWPRNVAPPATGTRIQVAGRWEGRSFPEAGRGEWAGRLIVLADPAPRAAPGGDLQGRLLRVRGGVQDRIHLLWGDRAPMVEALVLARREHLDPELREAFGLSGTAHLLAISGFHVGVVAGLLLALFRLSGLTPRRAAAAAAAGSWLYVLGIGAPDAALRAAVILTLLAGARFRGVPAMSVGTLSTAFLLLLIADPASLASVGFQLSFAGTLGLVALRRPVERSMDQLWVRVGRRPPRRGPSAAAGDRWLRGSSEGLAAGIAATLPTLPLLAWHFDRVSLVGVLATLAVSPGVALAIPGIGASLLLSLVALPLGGFLAGGVGLILAGVEAGVRFSAGLPGASIWVSRPALVASVFAGVGFALLLRRWWSGRIRAPMRRVVAGVVAAVAVVLLPLAPGARPLELHVLDVGQGDAAVLRLPGGGWIAVDAGPSSPGGWDAGHRRVVPYLRRLGVRRLEALVLTHAHLDHLGGAAAVLRGIPVRGVLEPARVTASGAYLETLREGRDRGVSWWPAEAGRRVERGGVTIEVLHPEIRGGGLQGAPMLSALDEGPGSDPNHVSVMLLVRYGDGSILLTGDAYADVEAALVESGALSLRLTVLKAGHHGSRTSTSRELLGATRPRLTVVSAGDGNRYGHPHAEVLERLDAVESRIYRTDRDGTLRIRIHRNGEWDVRSSR